MAYALLFCSALAPYLRRQMRTHPKTLVIDPLIDGANGAQL